MLACLPTVSHGMLPQNATPDVVCAVPVMNSHVFNLPNNIIELSSLHFYLLLLLWRLKCVLSIPQVLQQRHSSTVFYNRSRCCVYVTNCVLFSLSLGFAKSWWGICVACGSVFWEYACNFKDPRIHLFTNDICSTDNGSVVSSTRIAAQLCVKPDCVFIIARFIRQ